MADCDCIPFCVDNGSFSIKAGFAQQNVSSTHFRTVIGKCIGEDCEKSDCYIGDEVQCNRDTLSLCYPIDKGLITNWDDMEKIWGHTFEELKVNPEDHPILLTEAPLVPECDREKMAQIMFESFSARSMYTTTHAKLSLCASGLSTGLVLDSGDSITNIVPIYEGCSVPDATTKLDLAGRDLTEYLMSMLTDKGYSFSSTYENDCVREIKETLCFNSTDYAHEIEAASSESSSFEEVYELPDGQKITVSEERLKVTEAFYQSSIVGKDCPGIHEGINASITKCDVDIQNLLYSHIVICGGSTLFPGMAERIELEVTALASSSMNVKVIALPDRKCLVCEGGAALTADPSFEAKWISKQEYQEYGEAIINRKCG